MLKMLHSDWTRGVSWVPMWSLTALTLLTLYITLLHRCSNHLVTPNPTGAALKTQREVSARHGLRRSWTFLNPQTGVSSVDWKESKERRRLQRMPSPAEGNKRRRPAGGLIENEGGNAAVPDLTSGFLIAMAGLVHFWNCLCLQKQIDD